MMIWLLYIRFIVPVLGVFYGTSLIADEVDDKTITYLFTRPIPRSAVLLGKYLAYLACTVLLVLPSVMLVFFLIVPWAAAPSPRLSVARGDLGMLAVGLAAYGAVFALVGARIKRPLVMGWCSLRLGAGRSVVPGIPQAVDRCLLSAGAGHPRDAPGLGGQPPHAGLPRGAVGRRQSACAWPSSSGSPCGWPGRAVEGREYVLEQ